MSSKKPIRVYVCHPYETFGTPKTNLKKEEGLIKFLKPYLKNNVELVRPFKLIDKDLDRDKAMEECLKLLGSCDYILLAPNWEFSDGCYTEVKYAVEKGIPALCIELPLPIDITESIKNAELIRQDLV